MRSVRFVLAGAMAASVLGGAVAVAAPAQAAKVKPLVVVPAATSVPVGESVALSARGGPARGSVSFDFRGNGCGLSLDGTKLQSRVDKGSTCRVWAKKVDGKGKVLATSKPVTVKFIYTPPIPRAFTGQPCTIVGTPKADVLRGTSDDDVICGMGGNDRILGRAGDDVIDGGPGVDVFNGGAGDNLCDYDAGEQKVGTCRYDDSPPEVSLSAQPNVVDATAPGAETRMTLTVRDEGGARGVEMQCHRFDVTDPNAAYPVRKELVAHWGFEIGVAGITGPDDGSFSMWQTAQDLPDDRWSWTADRDAMTFDLRLPIGRAVASGPVTCSIYAKDRLGHEDWTIIDNAFQVTVSGGGAAASPTVESLLMSPSVIDMTKGGRQATALITVDAPTGIADFQTGCFVRDRQITSGTNGFGLFYNSGGSGLPYTNSEASHGPQSAVFTMNQSGSRHVLHYTWPMQASMPSGTYDCYVQVTDHDGQQTRQDFTNVVTLADSAWRDVEGPTLNSVSISPNAVDVGRRAQTVTISVDVTDPAGVEGMTVGCGPLDINGMVKSDLTLSVFARPNDVFPDQWIVYTGRHGVNHLEIRIDGVDARYPRLEVPLVIPFGFAPATYSCYAMLTDELGNMTEQRLPDLLTVKRTWAE